MAVPRVAVAPDRVRTWLAEAVVAGGGEVVTPERAEALVWASTGGAGRLRELLDAYPGVRWVQLPWAGIEPFLEVLDGEREWTCAKGVYARPVAEHAVMLALAGLRGLGVYARAETWSGPRGANLVDAPVTIVGGGGIAESIVDLLAGFAGPITVVRRRPREMAGVDEVVGEEGLDGALAGRRAVFLALPLVPATRGLFDERRLRLLDGDAWLVNVARGAHVVTDDLVRVLEEGAIGGAALDVTDPEPLSDGHRLWTTENCLITPHVGNTPEMARPLLSDRIAENVRRMGAGEPLLGRVDPDAGY